MARCELDVRFHTGKQNAGLPIVAGLDATDHAFELVGRAGSKQRGRGGGIAKESIRSRCAGAAANVEAEIGACPSPFRRDRRLEDRRAVASRRVVAAQPPGIGKRPARPVHTELGVEEELEAAHRPQDFILAE